jgi:hypothetical protein
MTLHDLVTRTLDVLEMDSLFYDPEEVTFNGINVASMLLCALKPQILVKRVAVTLEPDQTFLDMRVHAPRRLKLHRVVLGDVTGDVPVKSQGYLGDLRQATLESLASHQRWMAVRKDRPQVTYRHTAVWTCVWPRAVLQHTLTLIYNAQPLQLIYAPEQLSVHSEVPEAHCDLIPEIAAALLPMKEGGAQAQRAVEKLAAIFGSEHLEAMRRAVAGAARRAMLMAGEPDGAA